MSTTTKPESMPQSSRPRFEPVYSDTSRRHEVAWRIGWNSVPPPPGYHSAILNLNDGDLCFARRKDAELAIRAISHLTDQQLYDMPDDEVMQIVIQSLQW